MENQASSNPLSKFFRQPAIYIKLPSNGKYWPEDSLQMPVNGEIPVYPMTTKDEIILKTPDALMNGAGVVSVIQSCCPNIINAWSMPNMDVDYVLIAIRIASYGHIMDFDTVCPHCKEENSHGVDLRSLLDGYKVPDFSEKLTIGELRIKMRPQHYFGANRGNAITFEEQKLMAAISNTDMSDEVKAAEIEKCMIRLSKLASDVLADSTEYIQMPDGTTVSNLEFITEFYNNVGREIADKVQTALRAMTVNTGVPTFKHSCTSCTKEYEIPLEFNYSSFFG